MTIEFGGNLTFIAGLVVGAWVVSQWWKYDSQRWRK
jgi:hypothetical protein